MPKNLLSDTDFTKGWDNRFTNAVWIGKVTKIECDSTRANVRVIMPDRLDHKGTPLISKPIPVLQICSTAKKSFAIPRIDADVVIIKLANATSDYAVLGAFYTKNKPPPVHDPKLDYTEWEGGHKQTFDANDDADVFLTWDFKGGWNATLKKDINVKTTDGADTNIESDGDVLIKSATGDINIQSPTGTIMLEQQTIHLKGTIILEGNIQHTGNMETSGVHHDSRGYHTSGTAEDFEALKQRVGVLEATIIALNERLAKLETAHG